MSAVTPADFGRFAHRVPDGAVIPACTYYAWLDGMAVRLAVFTRDITQLPGEVARWTAEPIPAPEPSLAERARALLAEPTADWSPASVRLIRIVAELAEKVEAQS